MTKKPTRPMSIPEGSQLASGDYLAFIQEAWELISRHPHYAAADEGIDAIELAHIIPDVPETVIALYVGINDAVCNKALVTPFLVRHAHKNVFAFDPDIFAGGADVPCGTVDARTALNGFEPPNDTWPSEWVYVMIEDASVTFDDLWHEKGYIDMIAAKFEDFTMLAEPSISRVCFFIDEKAFDHPVNAARSYLRAARERGVRHAHEFTVPDGLTGETDGLAPVILNRGEKLYVARSDCGPCAHAWSNIHPSNSEYAVINENSAVPLNLITAKPQTGNSRSSGLIPAKGSADMTTDWFFRGTRVARKPILAGAVRG